MGEKSKVQKAEADYRRIANQTNAMLLCSHVYLLVMFIVMHIELMVIVNIISVAIYIMNFYWSGKNIKVFFGNAYLEILLHMILAILSVGWDGGFQMYAFVLILSIYYCDYLGKKIGIRTLHPRTISIVVIILYVMLYMESHHFSPLYRLESPKLYQLFFVVNALFVLTFIIVYVENYEMIVLQTETSLMDAAEKDELTMMNNRRSMQEKLDVLLDTVDKEAEIAIAIFDIDDFKMVNDTYGHYAGDMILREVAGRIKEKESETICSCRWGGEEFLMLVVEKDAYRSLIAAISDLLETIRGDSYYYEKSRIQITVSAGVSVWEEGEKIEHTINRADECLYEAKASGKDKYIAKKAKDKEKE